MNLLCCLLRRPRLLGGVLLVLLPWSILPLVQAQAPPLPVRPPTQEIAPQTVTITGPEQAQVTTPIRLTAQVRPPETTAPLTYTWHATGLPPLSSSHTRREDEVSLSFATPGTKVITLTATNAAGSASATHWLIIRPAPRQRVLLPLLRRLR